MTSNDRSSRRWRRRITAVSIVLALLAVFTVSVRSAVAELFYVPSNAATPEIPRGARVLVYKLGDAYQPGHIIVYRAGDVNMLARVIAVGPGPGELTVGSNGLGTRTIRAQDVVGRVILNTR